MDNCGNHLLLGAPLTYFTDGGEGGRGSEGVFWLEGFFFRSIKDGGIFWVAKLKNRNFLGYCTFHQLKSTMNISAIYYW